MKCTDPLPVRWGEGNMWLENVNDLMHSYEYVHTLYKINLFHLQNKERKKELK